ncbi:MAG: hypothetical protein WBX07_08630, partial [Rhodoplanes sp.]
VLRLHGRPLLRRRSLLGRALRSRRNLWGWRARLGRPNARTLLRKRYARARKRQGDRTGEY